MEVKNKMVDLKNIAKNNEVEISSTIFETSSIVKTLLSYANSNKIDLIVVGSRGQSGIKEMFLGSISNGIVHKAKQPVLIVK